VSTVAIYALRVIILIKFYKLDCFNLSKSYTNLINVRVPSDKLSYA